MSTLSELSGALCGRLDAKPIPKQPRKLSVFISSTFTDTEVERNAFVAKVYPKVRSYATSLGLEFEAVEMRWGIRDEASSDHKTTELCMHQLERCKRESDGLFFVSLWAHKYGWKGLPRVLSKGLVDPLLAAMPAAVTKQFHAVYELDENAVPAAYTLVACKGRNESLWKLHDRVRQALLAASEGVWESATRRAVFGRSVTEAECEVALEGLTEESCHAGSNPKVVWLRRCFDAQVDPEDPAAHRFIDVDADGQPDEESVAMWTEYAGEGGLLENKIRLLGNGGMVKDFMTTYLPGQGVSDESPHVAEMCHTLEEILKSQLDAIKDAADEWAESIRDLRLHTSAVEEAMHHLEWASQKRTMFFGRDSLVQKVVDYILHPRSESAVSCVGLVGPSGCGKTALMAQAAKAVQNSFGPDGGIVLCRFFGTSELSGTAHDTLLSLVHQWHLIKKGLGLPAFAQSKSPPQKCFSISEAYDLFHAMIQEIDDYAGSEKLKRLRNTVIFLDSLDQMREISESRSKLFWLPPKKPKYVRIVLSSLPDTDDGTATSAAGPTYDYGCSRRMRHLGIPILFLPTLGQDDVTSMLDGALQREGRTLTPDQRAYFLQVHAKDASPLLFQLNLREVLRWSSSFPGRRLSPTVRIAIHRELHRLEVMYGGAGVEPQGDQLVWRALSYISFVSKYGLSFQELADVLSLDDAVLHHVFQYWEPPVYRMPSSVLRMLLSELEGLLVTRENGLLGWYHRQLWESAQERYCHQRVRGRKNSVKEHEISPAGASEAHTDETTLRLHEEAFQKYCRTSYRSLRAAMQENTTAVSTGDKLASEECRKPEAPAQKSLEGNLLQSCLPKVCFGSSIPDDDLILDPIVTTVSSSVVEETKPSGLAETDSKGDNGAGEFVVPPVKHLYEEDFDDSREAPSLPLLSQTEFEDMMKGLRTNIIDYFSGKWHGVPKAVIHPSWSEETNRALNLTEADRLVPAQPMVLAGDFLERCDYVVNDRRGEELVPVLLAAGCYEEAAEELCNLQHVECRIVVGQLWSIVRQLQSVLKAGRLTADSLLRARAQAYFAFLRLKGSFLAVNPGMTMTEALGEPAGTVVYEDAYKWYSSNKFLGSKEWFSGRIWKRRLPQETSHRGLLCTMVSPHTVTSVAMSPDGKVTAVGTGPIVRLLDEVGETIKTLDGHEDQVRAVAFSSDGKNILSGSMDHSVRLWDTDSGTCLRVMHGHTLETVSVAFSPDNQLLVSSSWDKQIRVWEKETGKLLKVMEGHSDIVKAVCFTGDGTKIVSGSRDKTGRIWSVKTGECLFVLTEHNNRVVSSVCPGPEGHLCFTGCKDGRVRMWDANTGKLVRILGRELNRKKFEYHNTQILAVCLSKDGKTVFTGCQDRAIRVYDCATGEHVGHIRAHTSIVQALCISYDGSTLVSGSEDKTMMIWDLTSPELLDATCDTIDAGWVLSLGFSPDGSKIISGHGQGDAMVWDFHAGKCLGTLGKHKSDLTAVHWSEDDRIIITASLDKSIRVWSSSGGEPLHSFDTRWEISSATFSKELRPRYVCLTNSKFIMLYDIATCQRLRTLQGHTHRVMSVDYSADGERIVSGGIDRFVRIWDTSTGKLLKKMQNQFETVTSVCFSPDRSLVASASDDSTICIWDATTTDDEILQPGEDVAEAKPTTDVDAVLDKEWAAEKERRKQRRRGEKQRWGKTPTRKKESHGGRSQNDQHNQRNSSGVRNQDQSKPAKADGQENNSREPGYVPRSERPAERFDSTSEHHTYKHSEADEQRLLKGAQAVAPVSQKALRAKLYGHSESVRAVAFNPTSQVLASASRDKSVRIWDVQTGECLREIKGHGAEVTCLAFNPQGSAIATGSKDRTITIVSV
eukprot:Rmarinus@m.27171